MAREENINEHGVLIQQLPRHLLQNQKGTVTRVWTSPAKANKALTQTAIHTALPTDITKMAI